MEWNESYRIGVFIVDEQHKRLVRLLGELQEIVELQSLDVDNSDVITKVIKELRDYTIKHFTMEEELMCIYQFPHPKQHIQEHESFIHRLNIYDQTFKEGEAILLPSVVKFLEGWLINHIMKTDRQLGPFLNAKGLQ